MVKMYRDSRIVVWDAYYINHKGVRNIDDKKSVIVQMERGNGDDFMVEIIDGELSTAIPMCSVPTVLVNNTEANNGK